MSDLMNVFKELTFTSAKNSDIKRENANIDGDTSMGTMLKYGSTASKEFYIDHVISKKYSDAHANGDIHIHDLDFYALTTTCCQIDLTKLFKGGFNTGHGYIREPNSIECYSALACIAIQSNQNEQHGGQSIPNFDYALADGVRKTYKKLYIKNLIKVLEVATEREDIHSIVTNVTNIIKTMHNIEPALQNTQYLELEKVLLADDAFDIEFIEKIQHRATKYAEKETERATYQAMESLIHNLNSMACRAGAQVEN